MTALDAGFRSLGPFNRAFKTETGVTPSEFRRLRAVRLARPRPVARAAALGPRPIRAAGGP